MATLYVVSTPIGNLDDITIRALKVLSKVNIIACEDTRRTGLLLDELAKRYPQFVSESAARPKLVRLDEHKELSVAAEIIDILEQGQDVALVSDAGTPLVSDPGYLLVSHARKRNISVISIPGASAVLAALTSSGLPVNTFTFLGFVPEKEGARKKLFESITQSHTVLKATYVLYCAPHKLADALNDMHEAFGDHEITLARELTKVHEEIWTGTISAARQHFTQPKGEFVILFQL